MRYIPLYISVSAIALAVGTAQAAETDSNVFGLGEIVVTAQQEKDPEVSSSTLTADDIYKFNKTALDKAVNLIPGVNASNSGGQRNEQLIYVRGFDRFQVPLSIDGIRIYLPADNRLDFSRFLTPDLAEIQVSKGYVSVLNGPGGMGGAINLVTRKPTKAFEATMQAGLNFDGTGGRNGYTTYGSAGTRQNLYYFQMSAAKNQQDHFRLSEDFTPTANENGGNRDHSQTSDWRINAKVGFTPNATDEYSLSFTKQSGDKGAPFHVADAVGSQRYWTWPYWDIQNTYFLSKTQLGEASYVKTKLYYNSFKNLLRSFDNATLTTQTLGKAFNSYYEDYAYGGSAEFGTDLIPMNTLKAALHYRRDDHGEWQQGFPSGATEPEQTTLEDTYSLALENTFHATNRVDLVAGISEDWRHLIQAEDYTGTPGAGGAFKYYPLADSHVFNWQGAAIYRYNDTGKVFFDVSSRTRFPTIFERFSSKFSTAYQNPYLKPERAINTELGWSELFFGNTRVDTSVFYSKVKDVIESVTVAPSITQSQNIGDGRYYGFEASITTAVTPTLEVGGNYTYLHRTLNDPSHPELKPTGTPQNKIFVYATWEALDGLSLTPNIEAASSRWTTDPIATTGIYYTTGAYVLANFQASYKLTENVELSAGANNIFDANYQLVDGYPEQGRSLFVMTRITF